MPANTQTAVVVQWQAWGPEAFDRARRENKLILLDSGATWCHWCHVMDRVTYEDAEVAELLNSRFVPVRIDRDRLPQVDAKYQRAMPLLQADSAGGWPLTVLLTPEGHVLFKGTFLPPRSGGEFGGSVGLIEIVNNVDRYWRENREQINQAAADLSGRYAEHQRALFARPGTLGEDTAEGIVEGIIAAADTAHGGFGGAPKFFQTPALALLAARGWRGNSQATSVLMASLDGIARGGVHDQVAGGFHRYSVDERWHVPHFEKMAYDNASLLALYADAHAATGQADLARVTRRTLAWIARDLTAPGGEGFYASQDADVGLDDDGDFFTWTVDEVRDSLGSDGDVAIYFYNVTEAGDMRERPGRNVLHIPRPLTEAADALETGPAELARRIDLANDALLSARLTRPQPTVDRIVLADLNGMMIHAHLVAWQRLGDDDALQAALAATNHALGSLRDDRGVFAHFRRGDDLVGVGMLDDQAWMMRALVDAFAATGQAEYLTAARQVGDYVLAELVADHDGLLSGPTGDASDPTAVAPTSSWQDAPNRSAASVACQAMMDLAYLTGDGRYRAAAVAAMESFADGSGDWSLFAAGYATAVDHYLHGPWTIIVIGPVEDELVAELTSQARRSHMPGGLVLQLDPADKSQRDMLAQLGYLDIPGPAALVCAGKQCLSPATTLDQLQGRIAQLKQLP